MFFRLDKSTLKEQSISRARNDSLLSSTNTMEKSSWFPLSTKHSTLQINLSISSSWRCELSAKKMLSRTNLLKFKMRKWLLDSALKKAREFSLKDFSLSLSSKLLMKSPTTIGLGWP